MIAVNGANPAFTLSTYTRYTSNSEMTSNWINQLATCPWPLVIITPAAAMLAPTGLVAVIKYPIINTAAAVKTVFIISMVRLS